MILFLTFVKCLQTILSSVLMIYFLILINPLLKKLVKLFTFKNVCIMILLYFIIVLFFSIRLDF